MIGNERKHKFYFPLFKFDDWFMFSMIDSETDSYDSVSLKRFVMQSVIGNIVTFRVHAPCSGSFLLDIFANAVTPQEYLTGEPMKFKSVCKFKVSPRTFLLFFQSKIRATDKEISFKLIPFLDLLWRATNRNGSIAWLRQRWMGTDQSNTTLRTDSNYSSSKYKQRDYDFCIVLFDFALTIDTFCPFQGSIDICRSYNWTTIPNVESADRFHGHTAQKWHRREETIEICNA